MKTLTLALFSFGALALSSCSTTSTSATPSCCGKDGKCCKEAKACCGKDGKCCKESCSKGGCGHNH